MNLSPMYVNPAIVTMVITLMLALLTVGGIVWKFADQLSDLRGDIRVMGERLNTHIDFCETKCPAMQPKPPAKRLP